MEIIRWAMTIMVTEHPTATARIEGFAVGILVCMALLATLVWWINVTGSVLYMYPCGNFVCT